MIRRVMAIKLKDGVTPSQAEAYQHALLETPRQVPGVLQTWLGRNIPGPQEWTLVWDMAFDGQHGLDEYNRHPYHRQTLAPFYWPGPQQVVERAAHVTFEPYAGDVPLPGIAGHLKRTLVIALRLGVPADKVREFEERLTQMPCYIEGIRNWAMSRNGQARQIAGGQASDVVWTHVWEQEYQDEAGIQDYMTHPFHWGLVDLFFDRDGPYQVAERWIHLYYPADSTILGFKGSR